LACGIIQKATENVLKTETQPFGENSQVISSITAYADSEITTSIIGEARDLCFLAQASGLEPNLVNPYADDDDYSGNDCLATNGCGAHVHSGTSCTTGMQGGHFYSDAVGNDPWATVGYGMTDGDGNAVFFECVTTGENDFAGRAFVVHANNGDRVSCGLLMPEPAVGGNGGNGGAQGDPHFKTWQGKHFDFHGECDLVLLQNKDFESGLDLDVHIRTKMRRDMSYIASAALRIGRDLLVVESHGVYFFNGVAGADLPSVFGGFEFLHTQPTDKQHVFELHLGVRERIKVKTYKDFVSVLFEQAELKHFGKSVGLMGDFGMGHMISRDGKTIIDDANAFGQEWQVLDSEPKLFHSVRFPQHPQVCTMPTPAQATSQLRRRLSESSADELAAEKACEHWGEGKDDCVFDVLTTGDVDMAVVGAY
jgi:hypothetical protein